MLCSPRLWGAVPEALAHGDGGADVVHVPVAASSITGCVDAVLAAAPERFALAGHSLGGVVALAVARRAPGRVSRLALLATSARPPSDAQRAGWAATAAQLAGGASARDVQRALLPLLLGPGATDAQREVALAMADDVGPPALAAQLSAQATRVDERPHLRHLGVPVLVLAGADDALVPVAKPTELAALVPGARLVVLPGVGHLLPVEAPGPVAAAMIAWLRAAPGGA